MKLRLTQAGYESYTGLLGNLHFTNGTSDLDVSVETAAGIANILQCERIDGVADDGDMDITDPSIVVRNTAGDTSVADTPAPVDEDNQPIEPVMPAEGTPEPDPV
jgi:hypothetical protein